MDQAPSQPVAGRPTRAPGDGLAGFPQTHPWLSLGGIGAVTLALILVTAFMPGRTGANSAAITRTPAVHASATATPTLPPPGPVIYQNTLATSTRNWPNSSHSYFADGGYEVRGAWIAYSPAQSVGDGVISTRLRQLGGPTDQFSGLLFRGANDNLYYFFGVSANQQWTFSVVTGGNGRPIVAPTTDSHIKAGLNVSNTITVRATGSHFVFLVNGVQVGQADDTSIASGRIGLINTVGALNVVYNDFTVQGP